MSKNFVFFFAPFKFVSSPKFKITCIFIFVYGLYGINVFAETINHTPPIAGKVVIGAYINGIRSIDIKSGSVDFDLYLWLRTKGEKNLLETIEIMNGSISEKSSIVKKKIGDENYFSMRISVKAFQNYDLSKFPMGKQDLIINFEDSESDVRSLQFLPDLENTKVGKGVYVEGWQLESVKISSTTNEYDTNYGDSSIGEASSKFSRATISIRIKRDGYGYFFKLLGSVFLAAGVAFLSFFIKPDDLDPRFGLGIGGIFAVVASYMVMSSMLPDTPQITLGEALLFVTMAFIFASLLESVVSLKQIRSGNEKLSEKLDSLCRIIFPALYLIVCVIVVLKYQ